MRIFNLLNYDELTFVTRSDGHQQEATFFTSKNYKITVGREIHWRYDTKHNIQIWRPNNVGLPDLTYFGLVIDDVNNIMKELLANG